MYNKKGGLARLITSSKLLEESKQLEQFKKIDKSSSSSSRSSRSSRSSMEEEPNIKDYENRITDHDIYLKPINKHIYNKKKEDENNKLFAELNKNNNGVIADKSIIFKKSITGGGKLTAHYGQDIIEYCNNIKKYIESNKDGSKDIIYKTENDFMKDFINDKPDHDELFDGIIPTNLKLFLNDNKKEEKVIININANNRYKYNMKDMHSYDNKYNTVIEFSNMGYNEDIVKAFEYCYINNEDKHQKFIEKQYDFITKTLSQNERIILNDYTKKSSFNLYTAYVSRGANRDWLNTYITDNPSNAFCFGDSFYNQIWFKYKERFLAKLGLSRDIFDMSGHEIFDNYWTIGHEAKQPGKRKTFNIKSTFSEEFNQEEWEKILEQFIKDINSIILKAPPTDDDLYCYRGVSNHYIHSYTPELTSNIFISTRFSSFSFNFKKSYEYYEPIKDDNKCMYKTVIKKGVNVLFLAKISLALDELEILTPLNSIFIYEKQENKQDVPLRIAYNNRDNKYGICSFNNQFNCANVIIDKTPEQDIYIL